jgi:uncharacterized membrane protein
LKAKREKQLKKLLEPPELTLQQQIEWQMFSKPLGFELFVYFYFVFSILMVYFIIIIIIICFCLLNSIQQLPDPSYNHDVILHSDVVTNAANVVLVERKGRGKWNDEEEIEINDDDDNDVDEDDGTENEEVPYKLVLFPDKTRIYLSTTPGLVYHYNKDDIVTVGSSLEGDEAGLIDVPPFSSAQVSTNALPNYIKGQHGLCCASSSNVMKYNNRHQNLREQKAIARALNMVREKVKHNEVVVEKQGFHFIITIYYFFIIYIIFYFYYY